MSYLGTLLYEIHLNIIMCFLFYTFSLSVLIYFFSTAAVAAAAAAAMHSCCNVM